MRISAKNLLFLFLALIGKFQTLAQNIDEQFNPFIKSVPQVTDLVIQADEKILIEGDIASGGDKKTSSLVRLLPSGEIDPSFEADVNIYLDTDIQPGLNYSYQIVSYNDHFQSDFSASVSVSTVELSKPEVPAGLTLEDRSGIVYLAWMGGNGNVCGYVVERSDGKEFVPLDTVTSSNYYDQAIEVNIEYQYRVKAFNVLGESDYSSTIAYVNQVTSVESAQIEQNNLPYPNPSKNIFIITVEYPIRTENIQIVKLQGKKLDTTNVMQLDDGQLKIDLSGEVNGVYILTIHSDQTVVSHRLVKR